MPQFNCFSAILRHYVLRCPHEYVMVHVDFKVDSKNLNDQTYINDLFPYFINHECTKALVSIDDVPTQSVSYDFIKDDYIPCSPWPREATKALLAAYKKEFSDLQNSSNDAECWSRIADYVNQLGQGVTGPICEMKMSRLIMLHLRVKNEEQEIDMESDDGYCFQLMDALFPTKKMYDETSTNPSDEHIVVITSSDDEEDPKPGCSSQRN